MEKILNIFSYIFGQKMAHPVPLKKIKKLILFLNQFL